MTECFKNIYLYDLRVDRMSSDSMSTLAPGVITGSRCPVFSWKISGGIQQSYRVVAATAPGKIGQPDLYDSNWIDSRNNLAAAYAGKDLTSRMRVYFQIGVRLIDGTIIQSPIQDFTVGLLELSDWQGKWICADRFEHLLPAPVPCFRKDFTVKKKLQRALLFGTAKGLLQITLNGSRVDEHDFLPGWSDFNCELQYVAYDVTALLQAGDNTLCSLLGDGWYVTSYPGYRRNLYGTYPEMLIQLELQYADGSCDAVATDSSWKWNYGAVLSSDIYEGERYNALREDPAWQLSNFDSSAWHNAIECSEAADSSLQIVRKLMPGVNSSTSLKPISCNVLSDGVWIYDFGQIITGRIRLRFKAGANAEGLCGWMRYGEVLNKDGSLYNVNYRSAENLDVCIAKVGVNEWESHFTFRGFRYVQLEVFSIADYALEDIELEAVMLYSDMDYSGKFTCGEAAINKLVENIRSSMRGNMLEVPMDCPQRDERMGWSGDAHIFFPTAMSLADASSFFRKYLHDLRLTQREDGAVCSVAPQVPGFQFGSAGWADALAIITWGLYQRNGDLQVIAENYPAVKKYLEYQLGQSENLILQGHPDHLSLSENVVSNSFIGTVFLKHLAKLTGLMAAALGKAEEAANFREWEEKIQQAFRKEFMDQNNIIKEKTQSAFALLFYFDMLSDEQERANNAAVFKEIVQRNGNMLDTGFLGTAYLCPALVKANLPETACDLLLQRNFPSWLYEVDNGATTIWERWDSYHPERGFANPVMNSFNHYANGAVGEYIFTSLAGVSFSAVTADNRVEPQVKFSIIPDERIGFAEFEQETPCGKASCKWRIVDSCVICNLLVPPNCTGSLSAWGIDNLPPGRFEFNFDWPLKNK